MTARLFAFLSLLATAAFSGEGALIVNVETATGGAREVRLPMVISNVLALNPSGNPTLTPVTNLPDLQTALNGKLAVDGNGSQLDGITAAQVGALAPDGDGSMLTGITAAQVGALAEGHVFPSGGLKIQNGGSEYHLSLTASDNAPTDNTTLSFVTGDGNRIINLTGGNLTVGSTANISGANSGDVTLAGAPNYITISGQTITRTLINLGSHVTGTAGVGNGGTGLTTSGTAGLVMTSTGTGFAMQNPLNAALARYQVHPAQWQIFWDANTTAVVSGSGSTTIGGRVLIAQTGTASGSRAQRSGEGGGSADVYLASPGQSQVSLDFARQVTVGFALALISSSGTTSDCYVRLGSAASNTGTLGAAGIGIRISNLTLTGIVHNGTTLNTSATLKTLTTGSLTTWVVIQSNGSGSVTFFVDGVLVATLTGGPTTSANSATFAVEALNGATAASTRIHINQPRIRVD